MIMTVAEFRQFSDTEEVDQVLEARLQALELLIRAYTNNNFMVRAFRAVAAAVADGNKLMHNCTVPFEVGDTLQITESEYMLGHLVTIKSISDTEIAVNEKLYNESGVVVTKVSYPADVKMGVVNLLKWELDNRDKVGVASETISRHSVTYFDLSGDNSLMSYPKSLLGFLKPYRRPRF